MCRPALPAQVTVPARPAASPWASPPAPKRMRASFAKRQYRGNWSPEQIRQHAEAKGKLYKELVKRKKISLD